MYLPLTKLTFQAVDKGKTVTQECFNAFFKSIFNLSARPYLYHLNLFWKAHTFEKYFGFTLNLEKNIFKFLCLLLALAKCHMTDGIL